MYCVLQAVLTNENRFTNLYPQQQVFDEMLAFGTEVQDQDIKANI